MSLAIETVGLSKTYSGGVEALTDLNMQVKSGESLGFLGPNGAGKTTTIQILLNLIRQSRGMVYLFEQNIAGREREVLKDVGALVGMPGYYKSLTPDDILSHVGRVFGMSQSLIRKRSTEVLDLVGIKDVRNRKVGKFSTGMKRRMGIAQILVHDPSLIILDEPTNGLDPKGVREVRDLINEINKEGKTIFMTTHNLTEADEISTRVIFLDKGRKIGDQPLKELRKQLGSRNIEVKFLRDLTSSELDALTDINSVTEVDIGDEIHLRYEGNGDTTYRILQELVNNDYPVNYFRPMTLSLEDIYLKLYKEDNS